MLIKHTALFVTALGFAALLGSSGLSAAEPAAQGPYPFVESGALRLEIKPRDAEVYVDGFYSGIVDNFDGMFQRLHVPPGEHEITVFREGYRTTSQQIFLPPGSDYRLRYRMEPLAAGESAGARPVPPNPPPGQAVPPPFAPPTVRQLPPPNPADAPNRAPSGQPATGTLSLHIQPADAQVLVDGQPWSVPAGQNDLTLDVSEGRHTVQVRKEGFVGYLSDVDVRRGETASVLVALRTQP